MLNERLPARVVSHDDGGGADKLPQAVIQESGAKWG